MTTYSLLFVFAIAALTTLLAWALRGPREGSPLPGLEAPDWDGRNAANLPQIRQALQKEDLAFTALRGSRELSRRVGRQRRRVVLAYLDALESEFQGLLRLAQAIAVLSPELEAAQEIRRVRLSLKFGVQLLLIRMQLRFGLPALPRLSVLGNTVSVLSAQMGRAMEQLGERAALAAQLASANGRGVHAA